MNGRKSRVWKRAAKFVNQRRREMEKSLADQVSLKDAVAYTILEAIEDELAGEKND